jgi:hypothetical protein
MSRSSYGELVKLSLFKRRIGVYKHFKNIYYSIMYGKAETRIANILKVKRIAAFANDGNYLQVRTWKFVDRRNKIGTPVLVTPLHATDTEKWRKFSIRQRWMLPVMMQSYGERSSHTDFSYTMMMWESKQGASKTEGLNIAWDVCFYLDGRIILKKYGMRIWFRLIWLRIGYTDE